jgi:hypothetical protein
MQQAEQHTRQHCNADPAPKWQALVNRHPTGECADHHDPFDAKVQNPGTFANQLSHRGEDQGRDDADSGCPEAGA